MTGRCELVFFCYSGNSRFIELEVGSFCDFDNNGGVFNVMNDAMDACGGDDFIAGFESGNTSGLFLALTLLRADEQEVEHHDHDDGEHVPVGEKSL